MNPQRLIEYSEKFPQFEITKLRSVLEILDEDFCSDVAGLVLGFYVDRTYTIVSSDGKEFKLSKKAVAQSELLKTVFEDGEKSSISVDVKGATLASVCKYMEYHVNIPPKDANFISGFSNPELYDLISAANYLNINNLLQFGCVTVKNRIMGGGNYPPNKK